MVRGASFFGGPVFREFYHDIIYIVNEGNAQAINIPTVSTRKKRERSTRTRCTYTGSLPKPTKFDPDDPALIDRFPEYTPDIDIGDRPPTLYMYL
jgi:hypothetical protein